LCFIYLVKLPIKVFKPSLVQQHTRLNIYRTLARPVLVYGSEAWTIRKADEKRLQAAETHNVLKLKYSPKPGFDS
jgi:hypothetical protein